MRTFIKAQTASLVATGIDFLMVIFFVEVFQCAVVIANVIGNASGAIVNFAMGRTWVFDSRNERLYKQMLKYFLVWCGYLVLTTIGMILMEFTTLHYIPSKVIVSIIVSFTYNYYAQKNLVFN